MNHNGSHRAYNGHLNNISLRAGVAVLSCGLMVLRLQVSGKKNGEGVRSTKLSALSRHRQHRGIPGTWLLLIGGVETLFPLPAETKFKLNPTKRLYNLDTSTLFQIALFQTGILFYWRLTNYYLTNQVLIDRVESINMFMDSFFFFLHFLLGSSNSLFL